MSKCALIGAECPRTADTSAKRFCPHWQDHVPEVVRDGSGRVVAEESYRGCFLPRLPLYLIGLTRDAGHSAAAFNDARNHVVEAAAVGDCSPLVGALVTLGVVAVAGGERERRLESPAPRDGAWTLEAPAEPVSAGG